MIPAKMIKEKCDDPVGDFCIKLRQKTKKISGFPLALQLVAFELIPQLLGRLRCNDELKLKDLSLYMCTRGVLCHEGMLLVQLMMEIGQDRAIGWGEWDEEIDDRRVDYFVGLIKGGHQFNKSVWWGADAKEVLYKHEERKAAKKRKRQVAGSRGNGVEGPALKQKRLSAYFRRPSTVDEEEHKVLVARVAELEKFVEKLKRRAVRHKRVTPRKELFRPVSVSRKKKKKSEVTVDERSGPDGDAGGPNGSEAGGTEGGRGGSDHDGQEPDSDNREADEMAGMTEGENDDMAVEDSESDELPPVLVPLQEGDGVPVQWIEEGGTDERGSVLYKAMTDTTYYVTETQVSSGVVHGPSADGAATVKTDLEGGGAIKPGGTFVIADLCDGRPLSEQQGGMQVSSDKGRVEVGDGGVAEDNSAEDLAGLDKLVDAIVKEHGLEGVMGCDRPLVDEPAPDLAEGGGGEKIGPENQTIDDVGDGFESPGENKEEGPGGNQPVTDLSDSSPCPRSEKHKPVEAEAHLASLLLVKPPFSMDQIVSEAEDADFPFFEQVLLANAKVLHLGAGLYDLDNEFFLDLSTPQKWVSTKHIEVLVDYLGERHAELLKQNRAMFVAPWFMEKFAGKAKTFNRATYKGRVFSDRKLAGYLTKEGQKVGVDVDTVYASMFWGTNHWMGLRISIMEWNVLVYDPDRSLRTMEVVMGLMTPVAKMLPYLVRKVCPAEYLRGRGLEPFGVQLMADGYQNKRSGDCGPVAVKFMELSATGAENPDVEEITDIMVDIFRKQYAMDVYKD
ncbi:hypothetical protein Bca4012_021818 [Brassica carinata]